MSADQIQQREEIDPDNIDKVPVEPEVLNKGHVPRCVSPGPRAEDHESKYPDADNHVQRVHPGHEEVEREVELGVARDIQRQRLVVVFLEDLGIGSGIEERTEVVVEAGNVVLLDLL